MTSAVLAAMGPPPPPTIPADINATCIFAAPVWAPAAFRPGTPASYVPSYPQYPVHPQAGTTQPAAPVTTDTSAASVAVTTSVQVEGYNPVDRRWALWLQQYGGGSPVGACAPTVQLNYTELPWNASVATVGAAITDAQVIKER